MRELHGERLYKTAMDQASQTQDSDAPDESVVYDKLFARNEEGITQYDMRFGQPFDQRLTPREMELLIEACTPALAAYLQRKSGQPFRILSFGIGSGRDAVFAEWLAHSLKKDNLNIELLAQDISNEGLNRLGEVLAEKGYVFEEASCPQGHGCRAERYNKDNLSIQFIRSHPGDALTHTAELIGSYDFLMSLYGVFSHITSYPERLRILTMLKKGCRGRGLVTVSTMGSPFYARSYNMLEQMRKKGTLPDPLNGEGVIYVTEWARTAELETVLAHAQWDQLGNIPGEYYVCYHLDQARALFEEAGWNVAKESVASIKTPPQITALPLDRRTDIFASRALTEQLRALSPSDPDYQVKRLAVANSCGYIALDICA